MIFHRCLCMGVLLEQYVSKVVVVVSLEMTRWPSAKMSRSYAPKAVNFTKLRVHLNNIKYENKWYYELENFIRKLLSFNGARISFHTRWNLSLLELMLALKVKTMSVKILIDFLLQISKKQKRFFYKKFWSKYCVNCYNFKLALQASSVWATDWFREIQRVQTRSVD